MLTSFCKGMQSMKNPLRILAALLAVVSLLPFARAQAEEEIVRLSVGTADGAPGGQVVVSVLLENCAGVDSAQFDLNYDPAALSVAAVTPGDLFPPEYCVANFDEAGRIRVACASGPGLTGGGALLTVTFDILSDAGSAVTLTSGIVTRVDADYNQTEAYVSIEDGGVSVDAGEIPAALVTPWIPATPTPTPSPTPVPTPVPEAQVIPDDASSAAPNVDEFKVAGGPAAYAVVAALVLALIALIVFSVRNRRRDDPESQYDEDENRRRP